jgi:hypothetical protein
MIAKPFLADSPVIDSIYPSGKIEGRLLRSPNCSTLLEGVRMGVLR